MPIRPQHSEKYPLDAHLIITHILAGFFATDAEWVIRVANPKASTLLRRPAAELEGHSIWDVFPGLAESPVAGELRAAATGTIERRFELFSAALYNWFELWAVPTAEGGVYVYFRDVTDRARASQSDAVREVLRRTLMDAPIAITISRGADHRYELLNTAARALVGGRDLEGMTMRNALPGLDEGLYAMIDSVYQSGEPRTLHDLEVTYDRMGDGTPYTGTFDITYQPMRGTDGQVEGLMQTAVETTAFAHARRLVQGSGGGGGPALVP
jgi:PAS domain-containing protein